MNADTILKPAVFLDRDGTLIEEVDHLSRVEDLRIFPFTAGAIEQLKRSGYLIIVITNQSGIGRRYFDEVSMHSIHDAIQAQLSNAIDGFYFCPHLPDEGCRCRKPNIGMIEAACNDFDIDIDNSWMVGDKRIDVEAGRSAGMRTALVRTGYGRQHEAELEHEADLVAENLLEVVKNMARQD